MNDVLNDPEVSDDPLWGRTISILIVEDEPTDAELVFREMSRAGLRFNYHRVDTKADFCSGLKAHPDLVISDFSMPQFDGMTALRIARAELPEVPFIIVSGNLGEERAIKALRNGATDYVLKNNLARLVPAVIRALQESTAQRHMRQVEQRFRDLVLTSQDWVWELDVDGHYVFCSPAVEDILGVPGADLIGTHHLHLVHHEDQPLVSGAMRSLDAKDCQLSALSARWRHRDGSYRWLERHALAVIDARGQIAGFRGTDRDVTDRKLQDKKNRRVTQIYRVLNAINAAVLRVRDRTLLLEEVCRLMNAQGGYAHAAVFLTDPGAAVLRAVALAGDRTEKFRDLKLPIRSTSTGFQSMTEQAVRTALPAVCNDLRAETARVHWRGELVSWGFGAFAALPLTVDRTVVGTLNLLSTDAGEFESEEVALLSQVAGTLSFALQYLEKEGEATFLAYFDPMTGLARRSLFCERLARDLSGGEADAGAIEVHVLDIQRLAAINDRFGRQGGDQLLQLVAERLKGIVREPTRLAYFGNGIFGVASTLGDGEVSRKHLRTELSCLLGPPFLIEGQEVPVSAWIGGARFPEDGEHAEMLVQNAEHAVKRAKESGEKYLSYARGMNAGLYSRVTLEHKLRVAIDDGQFILHYQPKWDLATGRVEGAEALLRWRRPDTGLVAPSEFIPVLEETGLIVRAGQWVIDEAVRAALRMLHRGVPPTPIAVNVSPVQLEQHDFVDAVLAASGTLTRHGGRLDIEITESALMGDVQGSTCKLQRLTEAGVHIAIDDFGTGYSSLGRLSALPVHALKIDRSFIANLSSSPEQTTLVSTIISLAHAFNLYAIAEGVETQEQRELLRSLRCDQFQGYLFAKPMPEEEFIRLLQRESRAVRADRAHILPGRWRRTSR
jgi:PAS domain S-box-containing protein/diguanylate cyclase (GGDEF)-like protein